MSAEELNSRSQPSLSIDKEDPGVYPIEVNRSRTTKVRETLQAAK